MSALHNIKSTSRLSRALKRLSLKPAEISQNSLNTVIEEPQGDDSFTQEDDDNRRFSVSFFRPPTRLLTRSSTLNGRSAKKSQQACLNLDSKVEIKLQCSSEDGVYRPGDVLRGKVMLDARDIEGRLLRSVKVRIEGKAKTPRYEIRMNNFNDDLERVIKTREWLFYSDKSKIFPLRKESNANMPSEGRVNSHTLPFTFDLPMQDDSAELSGNIVAHTTPDWRKPTGLPPTCKIGDAEEEVSLFPSSKCSSLMNLFHSTIKPNRCDISYSVIVDVQWQRDILHNNKVQAKMDFVVHPSPPTTSSVSINLGPLHRGQTRRMQPQFSSSPAIYTSSDTRRGRYAIESTITTNEVASGQANWRHERSSYLSQRLSRDLSTMLSDTDTINSSNNREMTVVDSNRGPRGWYIERCTHKLTSGQEVLLEFSYPAVPCLFMDQDVQFQLKVTHPTLTGEGIQLIASDVKFDLLRHIDSYSLGGRLCLERKNKSGKVEDSISVIEVSDLKCKDTSAAPTDEYSAHGNYCNNESRKLFTGKFRINSGLEKAQDAMNISKSVTLDAINTRCKIHVPSPAAQILLPSFKFRGLSVIYTIGIRLSLAQVCADMGGDEDAIEILPPIQTMAETSSIQLQSQSSSCHPVDLINLQLDTRDSSYLSATSLITSSDPLTSRASVPTLSLVIPASHSTAQNAINVDTIQQRSLNSSSMLDGHQFLSPPTFRPDLPNEGQQTTSICYNNEIKQPIASNHAHLNQNTERQPANSIEYIYESLHSPAMTNRARSSTLASHFSAQTLDGLPPPYCSPTVCESRRF